MNHRVTIPIPSTPMRMSDAVAAWREAERLAAEAHAEIARTRLSSQGIARQIIAAVAAEHGVTVAEIVGHRRSLWIVKARWEAIRRVADETGWSLHRIGRAFGDRDHTTILHALRKMGVDYRGNDPLAHHRAEAAE
jgi:chromosomal replication initiation ATPase DnaA